jgi:hypothetical protein
MQDGDPRADPAVVDLIELAGLWLGADDRGALARALQRLVELLDARYPGQEAFRARFASLLQAVETRSSEQLRREYRRATLG